MWALPLSHHRNKETAFGKSTRIYAEAHPAGWLFTLPNITAMYHKSSIQAAHSLANPFLGYLRFENVKHFSVNCQQVRITRWKIGKKIKKRSHCRNNLPSCPELWRCSPRSQPNTRSLRIPRCRSFWGGGRDFIKVLRNVTSLPCFLHTD